MTSGPFGSQWQAHPSMKLGVGNHSPWSCAVWAACTVEGTSPFCATMAHTRTLLCYRASDGLEGGQSCIDLLPSTVTLPCRYGCCCRLLQPQQGRAVVGNTWAYCTAATALPLYLQVALLSLVGSRPPRLRSTREDGAALVGLPGAVQPNG